MRIMRLEVMMNVATPCHEASNHRRKVSRHGKRYRVAGRGQGSEVSAACRVRERRCAFFGGAFYKRDVFPLACHQ